MHKIVISGYYGFNNIGDESILKAVIDNLRDKLDNLEITVLSQNPISTSQKYYVKSIPRMDFIQIFKAIRSSDLLISGGGSLLQDVTSKRSIAYYLMIIWVALILRKKVFIYSQGIGPILSKINRCMVCFTLKRVNYIVVRDESSKELLTEIGIDCSKIIVTTDPVVRVKKADLHIGSEILEQEGFIKDSDRISVGFAIRGRKVGSDFIDEICNAIEGIIANYNAQILLIPFHFSEDMAVISEIKGRLGDSVQYIEHKYLTEEMLSIIGNMDFLVGVRLHSLIHAAIMDVPMIAVSYDPKVNSFMHSIGMKALCSVYDFNGEFFLEEFDKVYHNSDKIKKKTREKIEILIKKLDTNEELIKELLSIGDKKNERTY